MIGSMDIFERVKKPGGQAPATGPCQGPEIPDPDRGLTEVGLTHRGSQREAGAA